VEYKTKTDALSTNVALLFTCMALAATALVSFVELPNHVRLFSVFLGFEGMALLISVLLSCLMSPPEGMDLWDWWFTPKKEAILVVCRQPLFYLGWICLVLSDGLRGL
jgi:hypothetical protein